MNIQKISALTMIALATHHMAQPESVTVVVSGQEVMQKSKAGKKAQEKLQAEQEQLSQPLQKDEKIIREKEAALQNKKRALDKEAEEINASKLLSQDAKQRKFEDLQDKVRMLEEDKSELERLVKRLQADAKRVEAKMSQVYQEEMTKLDTKIKEGIEMIATREGWDIVDMKEQKLFVSKKVDKTDMIIKELDGHELDMKKATEVKKATTTPAAKTTK